MPASKVRQMYEEKTEYGELYSLNVLLCPVSALLAHPF